MPMLGVTVVYFGAVNVAVVACHMWAHKSTALALGISLKHSSGEYDVDRNRVSRRH